MEKGQACSPPKNIVASACGPVPCSYFVGSAGGVKPVLMQINVQRGLIDKGFVQSKPKEAELPVSPVSRLAASRQRLAVNQR